MKTKEINLKFEDAGITVKFLKETETLLKENQSVSLPELKELILFNADNLLKLNIISDNFITKLFILATFSKNFKYSLRLEEVFGNRAFGRSGGNKLFAIFRISPYIFKNFRMKNLDDSVLLENGVTTIEIKKNAILKYNGKELSEILFENIEDNKKTVPFLKEFQITLLPQHLIKKLKLPLKERKRKKALYLKQEILNFYMKILFLKE